MVTIRFASIVLPEPGGPTSTRSSQNTYVAWPFTLME
jgi:hypothetical protein